MGAEDDLWQRVDLAAGNKIPDAVAEMRSAIWLIILAGDPCQRLCFVGIVAAYDIVLDLLVDLQVGGTHTFIDLVFHLVI